MGDHRGDEHMLGGRTFDWDGAEDLTALPEELAGVLLEESAEGGRS